MCRTTTIRYAKCPDSHLSVWVIACPRVLRIFLQQAYKARSKVPDLQHSQTMEKMPLYGCEHEGISATPAISRSASQQVHERQRITRTQDARLLFPLPPPDTVSMDSAIAHGLSPSEFIDLERAALQRVGACTNGGLRLDFEYYDRFGRCGGCEVKDLEKDARGDNDHCGAR